MSWKCSRKLSLRYSVYFLTHAFRSSQMWIWRSLSSMNQFRRRIHQYSMQEENLRGAGPRWVYWKWCVSSQLRPQRISLGMRLVFPVHRVVFLTNLNSQYKDSYHTACKLSLNYFFILFSVSIRCRFFLTLLTKMINRLVSGRFDTIIDTCLFYLYRHTFLYFLLDGSPERKPLKDHLDMLANTVIYLKDQILSTYSSSYILCCALYSRLRNVIPTVR